MFPVAPEHAVRRAAAGARARSELGSACCGTIPGELPKPPGGQVPAAPAISARWVMSRWMLKARPATAARTWGIMWFRADGFEIHHLRRSDTMFVSGNDMMAGTKPSLSVPETCHFPSTGRHDGCHGTPSVSCASEHVTQPDLRATNLMSLGGQTTLQSLSGLFPVHETPVPAGFRANLRPRSCDWRLISALSEMSNWRSMCR